MLLHGVLKVLFLMLLYGFVKLQKLTFYTVCGISYFFTIQFLNLGFPRAFVYCVNYQK